MVAHPSEYPAGSSDGFNALGEADPVVTPHPLYLSLDAQASSRQSAYRRLFRHHIGEKALTEIREATHTAWVLDDDRHREKVAELPNRRAWSKPKGGDRSSKAFRETIDRV